MSVAICEEEGGKWKITMTRGDTMRAKVGVMVDKEEYELQENDEIRFALKRSVLNSAQTEYKDAEPLILKIIPNETRLLELDPSDTKSLGFGRYDFDIQITFEDGTVDTFIEGTLKLTREVD